MQFAEPIEKSKVIFYDRRPETSKIPPTKGSSFPNTILGASGKNLKSTSFNGIIGELNTFFSGRIGEMYIFYNQYGITLFGQTIYTIGIKDAIILGQKWTGLDTSYLNYTLRYGIIFMSFISIMYIKIGNYIKREKMLVDAIYIILWYKDDVLPPGKACAVGKQVITFNRKSQQI